MHKFSTLPTTNLINYMSSPWRGFEGHEFLGFIPIVGRYTTWGIELDGTDHCAVHVLKTREGFFWGDDPRETEELARQKPWVLMYYGSDNSSFFRRFESQEKALEFFKTLERVDIDEEGVMSYNS